MKLKELQRLVGEGVEKEEIKFLCRFNESNYLTHTIYQHTRKVPSEYDGIILLPVVDKRVDYRYNSVWNVYGVIKKD